MNVFGERLTALLLDKDLSQGDLANILHVEKPTISRYCNGRVPNAEIVVKIANYFDVTTDYLYGRVDDPKNSIIYLPEDYEIEIKGDTKTINKDTLESLIKKLESVGFDIDKLLK